MKNKSVTVSINSSNHYTQQQFAVKVGEKIKLGRNSWFLSRQRIKNKQMVYRLLRKEFYPYFICTYIDNTQPYQHTLTVKPYNF